MMLREGYFDGADQLKGENKLLKVVPGVIFRYGIEILSNSDHRTD